MCSDSPFNGKMFKRSMTIQCSAFLILYSACSEAEAGPVYVEYDTEDDRNHDEEQNDADQAAAASASFGTEGFLKPVIYFAIKCSLIGRSLKI